MTVQSRAMSLVEALINVAAGFLVALAAQLIVFPWFGLYPALGEHLTIGAIFAAVSVVRFSALPKHKRTIFLGLVAPRVVAIPLVYLWYTARYGASRWTDDPGGIWCVYVWARPYLLRRLFERLRSRQQRPV